MGSSFTEAIIHPAIKRYVPPGKYNDSKIKKSEQIVDPEHTPQETLLPAAAVVQTDALYQNCAPENNPVHKAQKRS